MNVDFGTENAQFPEKEYINGVFVAVYIIQLQRRGGKWCDGPPLSTRIDPERNVLLYWFPGDLTRGGEGGRQDTCRRHVQENWESTSRRTENSVTKERSRLTRAGEQRTELQKTGAGELEEYVQEN
jgi:hypothetical protein